MFESYSDATQTQERGVTEEGRGRGADMMAIGDDEQDVEERKKYKKKKRKKMKSKKRKMRKMWIEVIRGWWLNSLWFAEMIRLWSWKDERMKEKE